MDDNSETAPFGGPVRKVRSLSVGEICQMYAQRCGYDAARHFAGLEEIELFECEVSRMRFWRPSRIAGDEQFYASLSKLCPDYYKQNRWEYKWARRVIGRKPAKVLEVGCGLGYFLKSLEADGHSASGLEMNTRAIRETVTKYPVEALTLEQHGATMSRQYDYVCSFQILAHVVDVKRFLTECMNLVRRGGKLIISTPNYKFPLHASAGDPFDLPPHHLNHFTPGTFRRIAKALGLTLVSVQPQIVKKKLFEVSVSDSHFGVGRTFRTGINRLGEAMGRTSGLGHTLLAVFRVPYNCGQPEDISEVEKLPNTLQVIEWEE